jgi:hypothetical protein
VTWTSNTSNNTFNLTGNVVAARAFDISGTEYPASNLKPSFSASATNGFFQNLGPFRYRMFAQPTNSVGYAPQQISTIVDNIPGSAFFQTYGSSSNSLLQFEIPDNTFSATTPFTVEWWQYMTDLPAGSAPRAFSITTNPGSNLDDSFYLAYVSTTGSVSNVNYRISYRSTDSPNTATIEQSSAVAQSNILNRWQHVALVGTVSNGPPLTTRMRLYIGGQYIFETSSNYNLGTLGAKQLGAPTGGLFNNTSFGFNGAITSFRFTKDAALYSGASLARPTPPLFSAPSGSTQALLPFWFSNDFRDRSPTSNLTNNFLSTVTWYKTFPGAPDLSGSMVFNPQSSPKYLEYDMSSVGSFQFGSNAFTVEFYAYFDTILSPTPRLFSMDTTTNQNSESFAWYLSNAGSGYTHRIVTRNNLTVNTTNFGSIGAIGGGWHHCALTCSNTVIRMYIDGNFISSTSNICWINQNTNKFRIGHSVVTADSNDIGKSFNGKITNFRIFTNSNIYSGQNFTPTLPLSTLVGGTNQLVLTNSSVLSFLNDSGNSSRKATNNGVTFAFNLPGGYDFYTNTSNNFSINNGFAFDAGTTFTASNAGTVSFIQMLINIPSAGSHHVRPSFAKNGGLTTYGASTLYDVNQPFVYRTSGLSSIQTLAATNTFIVSHSNINGATNYSTAVTAPSGVPFTAKPVVRITVAKNEITG